MSQVSRRMSSAHQGSTSSKKTGQGSAIVAAKVAAQTAAIGSKSSRILRIARVGVPALLLGIAGFALVKAETSRFAFAAGTTTKMMTTSLECSSLSRMLLAQLGINQQVLAAIGASPQQTREVVLAARALCEARGGDFDAAEATVSEIQASVSELADRVQRGFASEADVTRLASRRQELAIALDAREEIQNEVRSAINGILTAEQRVQLDNIVAARDVVVPTYWKVEARDDRSWIALRDQLAQTRTDAREAEVQQGEGPVGPGQTGLTPVVVPDVAMSPAVSEAKSRLEGQGRAVSEAWSAALRQ